MLPPLTVESVTRSHTRARVYSSRNNVRSVRTRFSLRTVRSRRNRFRSVYEARVPANIYRIVVPDTSSFTALRVGFRRRRFRFGFFPFGFVSALMVLPLRVLLVSID